MRPRPRTRPWLGARRRHNSYSTTGLPEGHTAAEKRGRLWFEDAPIPFAVNSATPRKGLYAICHSGPMLDTSNGKNPLPVPPFPTPPETTTCDSPAQTGTFVPAGTRFQSVLDGDPPIVVTPQDKADLLAFLQLL